MSVESSWFVGSFTLASSVTIVVNGVSNAVIAAGTYYLYDASAGLNLLAVILAAVAPFMTDEAIYVAQDRKLRVTASVAFTWTIPTELQAILGFGASISSTTSATATDVSTLLWSPGWPATPIGHPTGVTGYSDSQLAVSESPSGLTIRHTINGTARVRTKLQVSYVLRARAWASGVDDGSPGELRRFDVDVLNPGFRWKHYPEVTESDSSSTAVTWPTALGPYKGPSLRPDWWSRSISSTDAFTEVEIAGTKTAEIS